MPLPDPIYLFIDAPNTIEKSHLAETLADVLLNMGFQVQMDPRHGYRTPAAMRVSYSAMPPIHIVEFDETMDDLQGEHP